MRILLLSHRIPFPPNKGDKIRSFNMLRHLAARHEVDVASLIDDENDLKFADDVRRFAGQFEYADISRRRRALSALRAIPRGGSITVAHFYADELQRKIDAMIATRGYEAILCFSSPMAEYVFRSSHVDGALRSVRRLMDLIDVDSYKWAQYAEQGRAPIAWAYSYEARRLAAYEERIARTFDHVFVVSEQERRLLPPLVPSERVSSIGNGVDLDYFAPSPAVPVHSGASNQPSLVFTGVMDYWPNVDGVRWFVESVFPRVQRAIPKATFEIVGSRPLPEVRKLAEKPGVTVTGFVPDVRAHVHSAGVCVVPLRVARGIQNKLLEAMAMGKAVVSTPQAFEGVKAQAGEDLLVAADEHRFAEAVVALLSEPARAARMGERARACMERHYSWEESLRTLDELLEPAQVRVHD